MLFVFTCDECRRRWEKIQEKKRTQLPLWSLLLFFSWYWKLGDEEKGSGCNCCPNVLFCHLFILPWAEGFTLVIHYTLVAASELDMRRFLQYLERTLCTVANTTSDGLKPSWNWLEAHKILPVLVDGIGPTRSTMTHLKGVPKASMVCRGAGGTDLVFLKLAYATLCTEYKIHLKIRWEEVFQNSVMGFPRWPDQTFSCAFAKTCVIAQSG